MRKIVADVLPHDTFTELKIPLNTCKPSFGIGIKSAVPPLEAVFLSSLSQKRALRSTLLPTKGSASLSADPAAVESYNIGKVICKGSGPTFSELDTEDSVKQRRLTECVHTHVQEQLPEGD